MHVQGTLFPFCLSVLSAYDFLRLKMVTENSVLGQYGDKENRNFLTLICKIFERSEEKVFPQKSQARTDLLH